MYVRALKCSIVPLVFPAIISGVGRHSHLVGWRLMLRLASYCLLTLLLASVVSITVSLTIKPGHHTPMKTNGSTEALLEDVFLDMIRNAIPDNIFVATFSSTKTEYETNIENEDRRDLNINYKARRDAVNMIGLVVFSFCIGLGKYVELRLYFKNFIGFLKLLSQLIDSSVVLFLGARVQQQQKSMFLDFFDGVNAVARIIFGWILNATPIGIASLLATEIIKEKDNVKILEAVCWYFLTAISILCIYAILIIPFIFWCFTRKNAFKLLKNIGPALFVAFTSSSSWVAEVKSKECLKVIQFNFLFHK